MWKKIGDTKYSISDIGEVRNDETNYIKKAFLNRDGGYLMVELWDKGKKVNVKVHRLVAEAFIPNPDNLPQVNHINEDKTDNRACNLEWCTAKYNNNYGTHNERMSKAHYKPVLCVELNRVFESITEARVTMGISQGQITRCCKGRGKTAGGYHWRYE